MHCVMRFNHPVQQVSIFTYVRLPVKLIIDYSLYRHYLVEGYTATGIYLKAIQRLTSFVWHLLVCHPRNVYAEHVSREFSSDMG